MKISSAINHLLEGLDLAPEAMREIMRSIMSGGATPAQIGGFLIALRAKGETVAEVVAAAQVLREMATRVQVHGDHLVDTCGTGGDGTHTFNISTASAFVAADAGGRVAKHGNRSVSSSSGSADVLEALGARIDLAPPQVAECIETTGCGFMFAPNHHPAMKNVAAVRRELGVRTIFNILGPLTNPAGAPNTLMGVFHPDLVGIQVRVMQALGAQHVLVVWGKDGLDEITLGETTLIGELRDGNITEYAVHPENYGLQMAPSESLRVADAAESKTMLLGALENKPGAARDIVALNAGAALYTANLADSISAGIQRAKEVIASGAARKKLDEFVACTRNFS